MKKQQGFVLIITVVVLFAATMISLYAMRGTIIQDKMTANINNKVITTNAAEEGATQFLNWARDRFKNTGAGWPATETDQKTVWQGKITDNLMPYTNPENGVDADNVQNGRYYWINPKSTIAGCSTVETNPCWDNDNHQVTVQITGNLIKGTGKDTKILGESIYQVRFAAPQAIRLPELPAALTLAGNVAPGKYEANSNNFAIDGKNKLAIATMYSDSNDSVIEAIKATNSGNGNGNGNGNGKNKESDYTGGSECPSSGACVKNADLGLWGDANEVMKLVKSIVPSYPNPPSTPIPNVTYINGNVSKIPACTGIIIINGDVTDGKSECGEIRGIVLILGGLYHIQGGGNTVVNGALYVANIEADGAGYKFGDTQFTVNGGGNMEIKYNSELMNTGTGTGLGYTSGISVLSWNEVNPENIE